MKIKELRDLTPDALKQKLKDLKKELDVERSAAAAAGGRSPNPGKIKTLRRSIAALITIIKEKGIEVD